MLSPLSASRGLIAYASLIGSAKAFSYSRSSLTSNSFRSTRVISVTSVPSCLRYTLAASLGIPRRALATQLLVLMTTSSMSLSTTSSATSSSYWNRETSSKQDYDTSLPIVQPAKVLVVGTKGDPGNDALLDPSATKQQAGFEIVGVVHTPDDAKEWLAKNTNTAPNVVFISACAQGKQIVQVLLQDLSESLVWIHARSAGIDFIASDALANWADTKSRNNVVTNAKGSFSSTLAEYTMMYVNEQTSKQANLSSLGFSRSLTHILRTSISTGRVHTMPNRYPD